MTSFVVLSMLGKCPVEPPREDREAPFLKPLGPLSPRACTEDRERFPEGVRFPACETMLAPKAIAYTARNQAFLKDGLQSARELRHTLPVRPTRTVYRAVRISRIWCVRENICFDEHARTVLKRTGSAQRFEPSLNTQP